MLERGASAEEVEQTVAGGRREPAKYGRSAFFRDFSFGGLWRGKNYGAKQLEVLAEEEPGGWLVITVLVRYF
jgi:hypothetical protein